MYALQELGEGIKPACLSTKCILMWQGKAFTHLTFQFQTKELRVRINPDEEKPMFESAARHLNGDAITIEEEQDQAESARESFDVSRAIKYVNSFRTYFNRLLCAASSSFSRSPFTESSRASRSVWPRRRPRSGSCSSPSRRTST